MRRILAIGSLSVWVGALGLPAQSEQARAQQEKKAKPPAWCTAQVRGALEVARRNHKRVLLLSAPASSLEALQKALKSRGISKILRYEYEVVPLQNPSLVIGTAGAKRSILSVVADAQTLAGTLDWKPTTKPSVIRAFLTRHQAPALDARAVFAAALADARRTDRRVLVHLGAPW